MLVLADNDLTGVVEIIRRVLESDEWREYSQAIGLQFTSFEELGMPRDAPDDRVWNTCQAAGAVLITGNRAGGADSLDRVIHRLASADSLPAITVADPQRVLRDGEYANRVAIALLDYLDRLDELRGVGRLFVP
jgi:hypothetical protein